MAKADSRKILADLKAHRRKGAPTDMRRAFERDPKRLAEFSARTDVLLLEPQDQTLAYATGRGFQTSSFQHLRVRLGEGRAGRAALARRIVAEVEPVPARPPSARTGLLGGEHFASYYGVPLIAKGQLLGVLEIFHRAPLQPGQEWLDFLEALAGQAAIAIENATLFGGLQRSDRPQRLPLTHGDVVVWGGPSRLRYHGVMPVKAARHPLLGECRINLTFRKAL